MLTMTKREYNFWVYIMASRSRTLYIGMTNGLCHRAETHRGLVPGSFTARYGISRLVYFEHHRYVLNAIAREKQLKKWTRAQKIALIGDVNPTWEDLFLQFGQAIIPTLNGQQIPFGNDNQKSKNNSQQNTIVDRAVVSFEAE